MWRNHVRGLLQFPGDARRPGLQRRLEDALRGREGHVAVLRRRRGRTIALLILVRLLAVLVAAGRGSWLPTRPARRAGGGGATAIGTGGGRTGSWRGGRGEAAVGERGHVGGDHLADLDAVVPVAGEHIARLVARVEHDAHHLPLVVFAPVRVREVLHDTRDARLVLANDLLAAHVHPHLTDDYLHTATRSTHAIAAIAMHNPVHTRMSSSHR